MRIWNRLTQPSAIAWLILSIIVAACGNGGKPGY